MKRSVVAATLVLGVFLALGVRGDRSPLVKPAAADPARVRQVTTDEERFAFAATVQPGRVVVLGRPPEGKTFLVTDVLVQNTVASGNLGDILGIDASDQSVIVVGGTTSAAPFFGTRLASAGLVIRTHFLELEQVRLVGGFRAVAFRGTGGSDINTLAVSNLPSSSVAAFVQVFGLLIDRP
jgi:hypothetical protein